MIMHHQLYAFMPSLVQLQIQCCPYNDNDDGYPLKKRSIWDRNMSGLKKVYLGQKYVWDRNISGRETCLGVECELSFLHRPPHLHRALILYYTVQGHVKEALNSFKISVEKECGQQYSMKFSSKRLCLQICQPSSPSLYLCVSVFVIVFVFEGWQQDCLSSNLSTLASLLWLTSILSSHSSTGHHHIAACLETNCHRRPSAKHLIRVQCSIYMRIMT